MEKNTVIIDLDRYEEMMLKIRSYQERVRELNEQVKGNILISKDDFYINERGSDGDLYISIEVAEKMVKEVGGYKIIDISGLKEVKINSYYFKLEKED